MDNLTELEYRTGHFAPPQVASSVYPGDQLVFAKLILQPCEYKNSFPSSESLLSSCIFASRISMHSLCKTRNCGKVVYMKMVVLDMFVIFWCNFTDILQILGTELWGKMTVKLVTMAHIHL